MENGRRKSLSRGNGTGFLSLRKCAVCQAAADGLFAGECLVVVVADLGVVLGLLEEGFGCFWEGALEVDVAVLAHEEVLELGEVRLFGVKAERVLVGADEISA